MHKQVVQSLHKVICMHCNWNSFVLQNEFFLFAFWPWWTGNWELVAANWELKGRPRKSRCTKTSAN